MKRLLLPLALTGWVVAQSNVVLIVSDDAGFADFGFQSAYTGTADEVPTPNLDTLAARGILCTNAYTASVCSPSRAAIVTGSYQNRIGYEFNINNRTNTNQGWDGLRPEVETVFERMGALGHTTGAIGKWHLGAIPDVVSGTTILEPGNRPPRQGVDEFLGILKGSRNYSVGGVTGVGTLREMSLDGDDLEVDTILETTAPWNTTYDYVTEAFGQAAVEFVERHHDDPEPFFLYVAFTAPHGPIGPSPDFNDPRIAGLGGTRKEYASMMITMDDEIGRLMATLEDPLGDGTGAGNDADSILEDTLVIFINDNGGASGNGTLNTPLQGWKGSAWEGGVRVPMIFAGAGITAPGGSTYDEPVHSIDLLPTSVAAGGGVPPTGIDGVNLLPFLNGAETDPPHEEIFVRSTAEVSLRAGDWKLTKLGAGSPYQLFDLATDIGESTDVAAAHPAVVDELIDRVTAYEAGFDKPRHAGLGNNAESINFNDHFVFAPSGPVGTFTPSGTLVGGSTLNGDFNASTGDAFSAVPNWVNLQGDESQTATRTNLAFDGTRNAVIAESTARGFGLDLGHAYTVGEAFRIGFVWRDASNWNDANDRIGAFLYITDDDTVEGVRTVVASVESELSQSNDSYQAEELLFPIVDGAAAGKALFLGIDAAQTGSGFARLDNVVLEIGSLGAGTGTAVVGWSDPDAWRDHDTGLDDTLLTLDAFPGCVLEFPVTTFSYEADNGMTRPTGLPFMLNRLLLSGSDGVIGPRTGSIGGNELLFTQDLDGLPPRIGLDADSDGFDFDIGNPLTLYADLEIGGDGSADFILSGRVEDDGPARSVTKTGTSVLVVVGALAHGGVTSVEAGSLRLDHGAISSSPQIQLAAGARLEGDGWVAGQVNGPGTVAPGASTGVLSVGQASPGTLEIEIDGGRCDRLEVAGELDVSGTTLELAVLGGGAPRDAYLIATCGSLTGAFAAVNGLPVGREIDYAYDYGGSGPGVAVVTSGSATTGEILVDHDDGLGGPVHATSVRNGGFEDPAAGDTFADTPVWENAAGGDDDVALRNDLLLPWVGGTTNAVTSEDGNRAFAQDTGWAVREGDVFDLSFLWRDASGWNDATDTFSATLFVTADDTPGGTRSTIGAFTGDVSLRSDRYQRDRFASAPAPAGAAGRRLFLEIVPTGVGGTGNSFARFDNVFLAVTTGTPETPYEAWTRAGGLPAAAVDLDADPNRDGVPNGIAFATGSPDPWVPATDRLPVVSWEAGNLVLDTLRRTELGDLVADVELNRQLEGPWTSVLTLSPPGVILTEAATGEPGVDLYRVVMDPGLILPGESPPLDPGLFARMIVTQP